MITPPKLDKKGYRKFGMTMGIVISVLFGLILPWLFSKTMPQWPWIVGAVFVIWAIILPRTLKYIYGPWMRFGHIIGTINTKIILSIVFFLIFTPVSFCLKILGKDMMNRSIDRTALTYWQESEKQSNDHMERSY